MDKFIRISSMQSGAFNSTNNIVTFNLPSDGVYDFASSYLELNTLNLCSAMHDTGVTSAAVPVKKQPIKLDSSDGLIFLSLTFIFFDLAISITVLRVIPSKKESGIGV